MTTSPETVTTGPADRRTKPVAVGLTRRSAFVDGMRAAVDALVDETARLYLEDDVPWVVGYSGGKDSTAVLQLVWLALSRIPDGQRRKTVYVITTDTLVENPIVAAWVGRSLDVLGETAVAQGLPIEPHRLTPAVEDSFWVNLIGRGYPAPRPKFRWCTERLKIKPSNNFIRSVVRSHGEAILVLGVRKAESQARAKTMAAAAAAGRIRDRLSPNVSLPNSLVYSPIEDWTNDDVWTFLMQVDNPWGYSNRDLLTLYQGASSDGECPLVVDSTTPSCGSSRFGCWTCTLVDQDKSMTAMITNDADKEWMSPLLELRNALDLGDDRELRDFRRMNGRVQLFNDEPIHGPYLQSARHDWLRRLLAAQTEIRTHGPENVKDIQLITPAELEEIRRIWVVDKHEFEDALPRIYEEATGQSYTGPELSERLALGRTEVEILAELCAGDRVHFEMVRELLDVEQRHRLMVRRSGLFGALESALHKGFYDDAEDAAARARRRKEKLAEAAEDAEAIPGWLQRRDEHEVEATP
ncbi:DNA sulfur modification protein DndC [Geodermatophilus dictyosporus]|uniref:DNA sulfur modification protein DndC n=1 Tax=Geodermatophilus dictyosporus TaxID=1523247 RepID=A0A1I5U283_9ACTN|nr:DNA phosphorothioation system sulfurtransferase DndC [Geodermatophilus dictyosporus]SFP89432.1 DNA sulfur modification protein DndC [Geodermatophilus dictyosporus]